MKVTLVSPTIYPLGRPGYAGIERLVVLFARGLLAASQKVTCICPEGSILPRGVSRISSGRAIMDFNEPWLLPTVRRTPGGADLFLDFSHSKPVGRFLAEVPHISPIWHDPKAMRPPEPAQNVVALSNWQAERFKEVYGQPCIKLDPICGDADYFQAVIKPLATGRDLSEPVDRRVDNHAHSEVQEHLLEDFCVFLGKLHPSKGALEAIEACKALKQRLVVVGPVTPGDPPDYVAAVQKACDGQDIIYYPEVTEAHKRLLFQQAKAILYPVSYPIGQGEASSHKLVEAMLCGTPAIAYDQGAMAEVIDQDVTGFVIPGRGQLAKAIQDCEGLDRAACRRRAVERWDYRGVVQTWGPIIAEVVAGRRWS